MNNELVIKEYEKLVISNEIFDKIILEENSYLNLSYTKSIEKLEINLNKNSELSIYILDLDSSSNTNITINLMGEGSKVTSNIRIYADKEIIKNFDIKINHLAKKTESNIINYAVLKDSSKAIINLVSKIEKGYSKSSANQTSKVISLSNTVTSIINPILEIKEFDVVGGHSATFSKITEEEIYYLQSRGFSKIEATNLITIATLSSGTNLSVEELIKERVL